jgi:site-specific DNA recombinase
MNGSSKGIGVFVHHVTFTPAFIKASDSGYSRRPRRLIVRAVPPIVSEQTFHAAQQVLSANRIMCSRNAREPFLLRSLIKCELCGLTFSGMRMKAQREHYYRCNGRQCARGLYGLSGKKCPSKSLNGEYVERLVWADIESFLRNPGELLERLRERVNMREGELQRRQKELADLTERLQQKTIETDRVLALFRRGRIDEATLDHQLDLIRAESDRRQAEIETATCALSAEDRVAQLQTA